MAINFFTEDIDFELPQKLKHKNWLKELAKTEGYKILELNYIFCSDEYLFQINVEYLNHDDYTDIITFDNSEDEKTIEGDIFISIDRVKENATKLDQDFNKELNRVISHGALHLMGYKDKSESESKKMRLMEDLAITLYEKL